MHLSQAQVLSVTTVNHGFARSHNSLVQQPTRRQEGHRHTRNPAQSKHPAAPPELRWAPLSTAISHKQVTLASTALAEPHLQTRCLLALTTPRATAADTQAAQPGATSNSVHCVPEACSIANLTQHGPWPTQTPC